MSDVANETSTPTAVADPPLPTLSEMQGWGEWWAAGLLRDTHEVLPTLLAWCLTLRNLWQKAA
jgi:hypothetical protein